MVKTKRDNFWLWLVQGLCSILIYLITFRWYKVPNERAVAFFLIAAIVGCIAIFFMGVMGLTVGLPLVFLAFLYIIYTEQHKDGGNE